MSADEIVETDYLVIGAGAAAMSFVDTLLDESDADIVMVDRHHRPGGHWNDAYSFVRLHQPAAFYGVNSRELGTGQREKVGLNAGLYELASGPEVLAYYDELLRQRFLPTGRVRWLPVSEYSAGPRGEHRVRSLLDGHLREFRVRRKIVDATHARTEVPSTHAPRYAIEPGVKCIAPNLLPEIRTAHSQYTVLGAGKTGVDSVLWLLETGVPARRIRWVVPRDPWMVDRANVQPGADELGRSTAATIIQFEAIARATSLDDLWTRLEAAGQLVRLDPGVKPTMFRCATISQAELAGLRSVEDVVRKGRVRVLRPGELVLEGGTLPAPQDALYVNCTASGILPVLEDRVFRDGRVNLLMLRFCAPVFSAALIAWIEAHLTDEERMNALCRPAPIPAVPLDWLRMMDVSLRNGAAWVREPALNEWLKTCRLNPANIMKRGLDPSDTAKIALLAASREKMQAAVPNMARLLRETESVRGDSRRLEAPPSVAAR